MLIISTITIAQTASNEHLEDEASELRFMIASQHKLIPKLQTNSSIPIQKNKLSASIKQAITEEVAAAVNISCPARPVEFYGQFHASLNTLDDGTYLSGYSSQIGLRSKEALDTDIHLLWQVEASINLEEGSDNNLRDTYGSFLLGRSDSAFERLHRKTNLFDEKIGDSQNIVGFGPGSHGFDRLIPKNTKITVAYAITTNKLSDQNYVTGGGHGKTITPQRSDGSQDLSVGVIHKHKNFAAYINNWVINYPNSSIPLTPSDKQQLSL